jgi:hypothetical protein
VHRVVRWQRAGWRQGTHHAKGRGEVSTITITITNIVITMCVGVCVSIDKHL